MEVAELAGTVVFAISGIIAVAGRHLDWFGAIVVGVVTAVGGGTIRGLILGETPVFWITDETYLIVALLASIAAIAAMRWLDATPTGLTEGLQVADAFGLALFSVVGASITLDLGFDPTTAVICGILTGVGGGVIRDLLAGQTPLIMSGEIYATAALAGTIVFVLLFDTAGLTHWIASALGMLTVLGLRIVGVRRQWELPTLSEVRGPNR